jgi:hypothetical protein
VDLDGDDLVSAAAKEARGAAMLEAAVTRRGDVRAGRPEMRALVLGDSDALTDGLISMSVGNQYAVLDGLKWLLGEEELTGSIAAEIDVPLLKTRQQDSLWFYGTAFAAPLAVLGAGALARRGRGAGTRARVERGGAP